MWTLAFQVLWLQLCLAVWIEAIVASVAPALPGR